MGQEITVFIDLVSGAILSNTLTNRLSHLPFATPTVLKSLTSSTYKIDRLHLSTEDKDRVLDAYMDGLRYIFIMTVCFAGMNLLLSMGSGNTSLKKDAKKPADEEKQDEEATDKPAEAQTVAKETKAEDEKR